MFWITFLVSATMAIALYTALSWATWYSGNNCSCENRNTYYKVCPFYCLKSTTEELLIIVFSFPLYFCNMIFSSKIASLLTPFWALRFCPAVPWQLWSAALW
jgi:hypothetical protein